MNEHLTREQVTTLQTPKAWSTSPSSQEVEVRAVGLSCRSKVDRILDYHHDIQITTPAREDTRAAGHWSSHQLWGLFPRRTALNGFIMSFCHITIGYIYIDFLFQHLFTKNSTSICDSKYDKKQKHRKRPMHDSGKQLKNSSGPRPLMKAGSEDTFKSSSQQFRLGRD